MESRWRFFNFSLYIPSTHCSCHSWFSRHFLVQTLIFPRIPGSPLDFPGVVCGRPGEDQWGQGRCVQGRGKTSNPWWSMSLSTEHGIMIEMDRIYSEYLWIILLGWLMVTFGLTFGLTAAFFFFPPKPVKSNSAAWQPGSRRRGPAVGGLHEHFPGANWTSEDRSDEGGQAGRRGLQLVDLSGINGEQDEQVERDTTHSTCCAPSDESATTWIRNIKKPLQLVALAVVSGSFWIISILPEWFSWLVLSLPFAKVESWGLKFFTIFAFLTSLAWPPVLRIPIHWFSISWNDRDLFVQTSKGHFFGWTWPTSHRNFDGRVFQSAWMELLQIARHDPWTWCGWELFYNPPSRGKSWVYIYIYIDI